jgi:hypothetical protein
LVIVMYDGLNKYEAPGSLWDPAVKDIKTNESPPLTACMYHYSLRNGSLALIMAFLFPLV